MRAFLNFFGISRYYNAFNKNYSKFENMGVSLGSLGTDLNSDFDEDEPYNREDSKSHTMSIFEKADKDFDHVMTDGANAYAWKYVDHIVNAPLDSSRYIISSAAVPFIGVVLHGSVQFAGTPLNMEGNIGYSFLKAIENGASLNFTLCYQNYNEFKEYMDLSEYYSVRYDILKEEVSKYYNLLNDLTKDLQLSKIVAHDFLIGERVPDADEAEADKLQSQKEKEEKELLEKLEQEKLYNASINHGRTDAADEMATALEDIRTKSESVANYSEQLSKLLDQLKDIEEGKTVTNDAGEVLDKEKLLKDIDAYLVSTYQLITMIGEQYVIAKIANADGILAHEHYVVKNAEGFSQAFKDAVTADYNSIITKYKSCVRFANTAYTTATAAFDKAKAILGEIPYVLTDPTAEPEVEAPKEETNEGYNYTKYTDDSDMIVRIEYGNGVFFILNFNYFDVTVEYNGQQYTVENYGGVRVNADGKVTAFSVNK